jgi:hypothetical protein
VNWNKWIRQTHRWLSLAFTVTVIANLVAMGVLQRDDPMAMYIGFSALLPLIPLLITGIYLFVLPYTVKQRSAQPAE